MTYFNIMKKNIDVAICLIVNFTASPCNDPGVIWEGTPIIFKEDMS